MPGGEIRRGDSAGQRLDKWLWFARIVKTRSLAATLVTEGRIRVNRTRVVKPSHLVRPGDILSAVIHHRLRLLHVVAAGTRRGPPAEAQALYEELTPLAEGPIAQACVSSPGGGGTPSLEAGPVNLRGGRPTKRERRQLERLKGRGA